MDWKPIDVVEFAYDTNIVNCVSENNLYGNNGVVILCTYNLTNVITSTSLQITISCNLCFKSYYGFGGGLKILQVYWYFCEFLIDLIFD